MAINAFDYKKDDILEVSQFIQSLRAYYEQVAGKECALTTSPQDILKHLVEYYENIISCMPGNVYWLDRNGIALGCNRNVLKMFGLKTIDEFKGLTFEDMGRLGGWSEEATLKFKKDTLDAIHFGEERLNLEEPPIPHNDGRLIYFLTSRVPLLDHQGKAIGIIGISVDITERKLMEEALRHEKIKAEQASRAKSEFIANMSHDLRTPLSGMQGLAEDILIEAPNERISKNASLLLEASRDLLGLIDDILNAARLESGQEKIHAKLFSLAPLVQNTLGIMKPKALKKSITLTLTYDDQIPQQVIGYHLVLQRILVNLLSNALKFTAEGGFVDVMIKLNRIEDTFCYIDITVVDTGIGIAADKLDIIFEKFSRVSASFEGQYTGSGMGLYMVKHYVEQIGGEVDVISEEGQGSRFHCEIPFEISTADIIQPNSTAPLAAAVSEENNSETIQVLMVEDNKIVQCSQASKLRDCGCEVTLAENGMEALSYFNHRKFDLLLVDLGLPDMDGLTLIQNFRKKRDSPNHMLPIILLTAHVEPADLEKSELAGVTELLIKPLMTDRLKQLLHDHIPRSIRGEYAFDEITDFRGDETKK